MSTAVYGTALQQGRDARAVTRRVRSAAARAGRATASVLREGREIVLTLAAALGVMVAVLALDVWIWVPQLGH
jgi:hypothetical protein